MFFMFCQVLITDKPVQFIKLLSSFEFNQFCILNDIIFISKKKSISSSKSYIND